ILQLVSKPLGPLSTDLHPKDSPTQPLTLALALVVPSRGDNQLPATNKITAGSVPGGDLDLAYELPLGRDLEHARLAVDGMPQVALGVDAEAVGLAGPVVA